MLECTVPGIPLLLVCCRRTAAQRTCRKCLCEFVYLWLMKGIESTAGTAVPAYTVNSSTVQYMYLFSFSSSSTST